MKGRLIRQSYFRYVHFCTRLKEEGIEPMVALHHFTHPGWFEKEGSFEREENIPYFVDFAKRVYEVLNPHVKYFCTINEPMIVAFSGYILRRFPPKHNQLSGFGRGVEASFNGALPNV